MKVTESIYNGKNRIIPMAQVSFVEKVKDDIQIVMDSSEYDYQIDDWDKAIRLSGEEKNEFLDAWTRYRYEVEGGEGTFAGPESLTKQLEELKHTEDDMKAQESTEGILYGRGYNAGLQEAIDFLKD